MFNYDGDYDSFKLGFLIGWRTGGKRTRLPLTALTSGDDCDIQKIANIPNLTSCSIACKKEYYGNAPEAIYIAYIADGVARIKTALHKSDISSHVWQDTGFSTSAIDVSIAFDGKMPRTHGHVEFLTGSRPYVFWVTSSGELKVSILGFLGEMILANENCTKVSAIRATQSDIISDDFGLVVFFIVNGQIYYRQHIKGIWYDAVPLSVGPSGVTYTDIRAFRTWDYRIGVQAKTSSGDVYEIFSQFQGIGKNSSEHLEITSVSVAGTLSAITYHDTRSNPEHLEITSVAVIPALYGGLYLTGAPQIISAYNIEDSQHDWGKTAVFVFDRHLVAAEVAAQPSTFSIVDSRNTIFIAQTASLGPDGKTVTLTFIDFNAARGTCTANYTPGTVTSMAGTALTATYVSWTPINLVAPQIPAPEVYSIENVGYQGTGIKRVRFYSTDGETLLETEYVNYGEDTTYGSSEAWALTPLNGIGVTDITENVTTDLDLYLARWRVRYYNKTGTTVSYAEYVIDGEDATWGANYDWASSPSGESVEGILNNITDNVDVYRCGSMYSTPNVLLEFDNSITEDLGVSSVAWAANGNLSLNTSIKKFGSSSLQFSGNGSYLQLTSPNDAFNFGSGDFTIDFWMYVSSPGTRMALFAMDRDCRISMDLWRSTPNMWFSSTGSGWNIAQADNTGAANSGAGSISVSANSWTHVAFVRSGSYLISFVNGQVNKKLSISSNVSLYYDNRNFRIGLWGQGSYPFSGYIDEFRVVKGTAEWTEAFNPPTEKYSDLL